MLQCNLYVFRGLHKRQATRNAAPVCVIKLHKKLSYIKAPDIYYEIEPNLS